MNNLNKYKITWKKQKNKGFTSTQEVTVYGEDSVLHVVNNLVPNRECDIYPCA